MTSVSEERSQLSPAQVTKSVKLFSLGKGRSVSHAALAAMLPDIETALFFAKAYRLDYTQLGELIRILFRSDVIVALLGEGHEHSTELQDYIIETVPDDVIARHGQGHYSEDMAPPDTELLAQVWAEAETQIATSILEVADKLGGVLDRLPSKYGTMTFTHLRKMNLQRNSIGVFGAQVQHQRTPPRLVVLDVSGSMTASTVGRIVSEVVGLAYKVNASLAIVSNTAYLWEPGTFDEQTVLRAAEYGGTQYEMLTPIFDQDWETVITIADYDSAGAAKSWIKDHARGRVHQVLDISLVNRPTFLAECVGQIADKVTPILIGSSQYVLS